MASITMYVIIVRIIKYQPLVVKYASSHNKHTETLIFHLFVFIENEVGDNSYCFKDFHVAVLSLVLLKSTHKLVTCKQRSVVY